ncbi:MAG TPA: DUF72 domain-containing protein [Candidatus Binatia bacterium]|nr:DUF72 domain-containing protein [Candidatus Binatia bacterium]
MEAAFCIYDLAGYQSPLVVIAAFVYVRLHGPDGPYCGQYSRRALRTRADGARRWLDAGADVHCYFDNDENGYAPRDALTSGH